MKNVKRVLLVDDSLIIRERLTAMLSALDNVQIIGGAESPHDAIDQIASLKPDVVILDLQLVGGSGLEVLENLKLHSSPPRIIVLTNFPFPEYRQKCLEAGADYFLDKATAFAELPDVFARLMPRKRKKDSPASDQPLSGD